MNQIDIGSPDELIRWLGEQRLQEYMVWRTSRQVIDQQGEEIAQLKEKLKQYEGESDG